MATVTVETARRARRDAQRLRLESNVLRLATRRQQATMHARLAGARATAGCARVRCAAPIPSPWSGLPWRTAGVSLDRTLVPLD